MRRSRGSIFTSVLRQGAVLVVAGSLVGVVFAQEAAPGGSAQSASSAAGAQAPGSDQELLQEVTVTGSRVITTGNNSPTPLTTETIQDLAQTTPSDIPAGLDKLPVFAGSSSPNITVPGGATTNAEGNFLNLRDFGTQRTLVLLDGNRVQPTAENGTIDIDTLPQIFVKRVDVVTGGASAVYGSDAVTGVVNFVLDTTFTGLKTEAQTGVSGYGDDMSDKAGLAAGTNLFDGRGHFETSYEYYSSDGIPDMKARSLGNEVYTEAGLGTKSDPYYLVPNSRYDQETPGGYIASGPLAGNYFPSTGVLAPYSFGTPSKGNTGAGSGGDGGYSGEAPSNCFNCNESLVGQLGTNQEFGRFDYDLSDRAHAYLQLSGAQVYNFNTFFSQWFNQSVPSTNVYLPASAAAVLAASKTPAFTLERQFEDYPEWASEAKTQTYDATAGFSGLVGPNYHWDFHYTFGKSDLYDANPYNTNNQNLTAALDSALIPAGQPNAGTAVCAVSLTAEASKYRRCEPLNPFGPNAPTASAVQYIDNTTYFDQYETMNDVAADISGKAVNDWAGPINAALSGEYRYSTLATDSPFNSTEKVDCTGLNAASCNPKEALYGQSVVSPLARVGEGVWEGAGELDAPLAKDLPLIRSLDLNLAARYTEYSISGPAATWKVGLVWNVYKDLTFRGTNSRDIRAPTLYDLYAPPASSNTGFQDLLTGVTANTRTVSQGNPALKPEVSRTATYGLVYNPSWAKSFSVAVDTFRIVIDNAITSVNGTSVAVQDLCNASNGTSPYCALYVRPISPTSTAAGNYPSEVLSESLNVAKTSTQGVDAELNYSFALADISGGLPGVFNTRLFLTYQPKLLTFTGIPGAVVTNAAGAEALAETRLTFNYGYVVGPFSVNGETRYLSSERQNSDPALVFATPAIPAYTITDLTLAYQFRLRSQDAPNAGRIFLSIQNLLNQQPNIYVPVGFTSAPGFAFPAPADEDTVGRYFTLGASYQL